MDKIMILVIDGCCPDYITEETAPNIFDAVKKSGFAKTVECAMPSVTNVNHACILSGKWPQDTKVIGNYYYDPATGDEGFIEERGYMKAETILQRYRSMGEKTALFTVKGKVLGVYGDGVDIGLSVQTPDGDTVKRYGLSEPPAINSIEATEWIVRAAYECIRKDDPGFMYCTTNDFVFHHFAPGTEEAKTQIAAVDRYISMIHEIDPERQIYITADHGMNQKHTIVNVQRICDNAGFDVFCLPPLKDRYIENHIYQEGGMVYVFVKDRAQKDRFRDFAEKCIGLEEILTAEEAAEKYHLPEDRIGDFVLLSGKDAAFGECEGESIYTDESRTHGSLYEREIPLIALNPARKEDMYTYHKDITTYLFEDAGKDLE